MENTGNPTSRRFLWSDVYGEDLTSFSPFPIQSPSLESAFSSLTLASPAANPASPPSAILPPDLGFLQQLRVRDAVNGQFDPSLGPNLRNLDPTAGMLPSWTYPTAGIYHERDLMSKQQYIRIGDNYPMPPELQVPQYPNRRRSITPVDEYSSSGYNRQRTMDLPQMSLRCLRGNIVYLAKNQRGCRLLQANLEGPTEEEVDWVLAEISYRLHEIMCDQFGNYVFQKLVKVANERQRNQISYYLSRSYHLLAICINPHGTRAVQKFLETNITQQQIRIVLQALYHGVVALSTDPNGHHVIQHCLKRFSFEDNKELINEMTCNCFEISTNKSGCCVMQSCVDFSRGEHRRLLISEIVNNAVQLAEDPYGNYVVQHLLDLKIREVTEDLLRHLEECYVALSCNKYASNVVQKCIGETEDDHSKSVIMECLNSPNFSRLLNDPYGNYVVQTALKRFKGPILKSLLNLINQNSGSMRNNMYGKKILELVQDMKLYRG